MEKQTCGLCKYYKADYGIWCANGWSGDGSNGKCMVNPKPVYREAKDPECGLYDEYKNKE